MTAPIAILRLAGRDDFIVAGKAPGLFLGKLQLPIDGDLENTADTRHQLDVGAVTLL